MLGGPKDAHDVLRQSPQPDAADIRLMMAIALMRQGDRAAAEALVKPLETQATPPTEVLVQWHAASGITTPRFGCCAAADAQTLPSQVSFGSIRCSNNSAPIDASLSSGNRPLAATGHFQPIQFLLDLMEGVVTDFVTGTHRQNGLPRQANGVAMHLAMDRAR